MGIFTDQYGIPTLRPFLVAGALTIGVTVGVTVGGCASCNNYDYSDGVRVGVINKSSKKGYVWKTYEGQMALEGIVSTGETVGANVWHFSIDKKARHGENVEELTTRLNQFLESGTKVKIKYIEAGCPWPTRGETSYYIQGVEHATKKE